MRTYRNALLCLAALATLALASADAVAQKYSGRGSGQNIDAVRPPTPKGPRGDGGYRGPRGGGWGVAVPGIIMTVPTMVPPGGGRFVDDGTVDDNPRGPARRPQRSTRRGPRRTIVPYREEARFSRRL